MEMEKPAYRVLIADDELIIRQGLRYIIDWNSLGFEISDEASNGNEALDKIIRQKPDLVLMDIRMPGLAGTEVVKKARGMGYDGHIIILSGYTDFQYAQVAVEYGVSYYLTKPIDEDDLYEKTGRIATELGQKSKEKSTMDTYREKANSMILYDILTGEADFDKLRSIDLLPKGENFRVVIYEKYSHRTDRSSYRFADLLKVTNEDNSSYDYIHIDQNEVLLLKGKFIQKKFRDFLDRYKRDQKPQMNSPLDSLFITYGREVNSLKDVHVSYEEALRLLQRRFFCAKHQHTIGYRDLPPASENNETRLDEDLLNKYCQTMTDYIQASKRSRLDEIYHEIEQLLYNSNSDITRIKLFLADLFLSVKERINHLYHNEKIVFPSNSEIIDFISTRYYLYEIMAFFSEQFDAVIKNLSKSESDNVIDDIMNYIDHNYTESIKLETIAPLFGYNSSYLGKIFTKKAGIAFNAYVDKVRIQESKRLLKETDMKVYEVAEKIGYHNVDYFHTKFKKYMHMSPVEYRKKH